MLDPSILDWTTRWTSPVLIGGSSQFVDVLAPCVVSDASLKNSTLLGARSESFRLGRHPTSQGSGSRFAGIASKRSAGRPRQSLSGFGHQGARPDCRRPADSRALQRVTGHLVSGRSGHQRGKVRHAPSCDTGSDSPLPTCQARLEAHPVHAELSLVQGSLHVALVGAAAGFAYFQAGLDVLSALERALAAQNGNMRASFVPCHCSWSHQHPISEDPQQQAASVWVSCSGPLLPFAVVPIASAAP